MSNMDKPPKVCQPECLDPYGLKPCTAEYLERMRNVARMNNYDVKSFFTEHDPLEFGTVTEHIFKSIFEEKFMCQCCFSCEQSEVIYDLFRMPDGMICYQRLVGLLTSDENIAQQLRECASKVPFPQVSEAPLRVCGARVFGTEQCVPAILERLRTAYWRLRIKLTDLFRCADPQCKGLVPEETFQRMLNSTLVPEAGITERQLDAVTNYYRACGNMIDYKRMADMFDSTLSLQEQYQLNYITKREQLLPPKKVNTLDELEEEKVKEIWVKVAKRANRHIFTTCTAYFDKFAHRQSGETTVPHLKRFLIFLDADLAESDFSLLCRKYATNDFNVNFVQLISDVYAAYYTICDQTKAPLPPILGADGPPYDDLPYYPMANGAGKNSSAWGHGVCKCASEDEHLAGACLPADSTRFYEEGPVCGGDGRIPIWGKQYVANGCCARPGQRYSGSFIKSQAAGKPTGIPLGKTINPIPVPGASEGVELRHLMERLQQYLYRFRVRTKEFFKPFDPLNSGFVSANRFRRALTNMGIGAIGRLCLSEAEYDALINFYRCDKDHSMACWRKFDADIESIFVQKGLEELPGVLTPAPDRIVALPYPGATNMEDVHLPIRQLADCAVARLRHRVLIESCNIKYFLQGFDVTNNGYISRQQFKQTLSMLNYNFSANELDAMSVKYCDEKGFNYLKLLADIEPKPNDPGWYAKYKVGRLYQLNRPPPDPKWVEHDIRRIMYKLRARMVRCRPQLDAFLRDHDLFNHDRIKIIDFHRAMDRSGFELTPREIEVLTCRFLSAEDPTEIQYRLLFETVENVFTVFQLHTTPLVVPEQWRPLREMDYDKELTKREYCLLTDGMRRLAKRVYDRRIEFKPMFLDFDIPSAGLVSEDQFHRVLHTVGLADLVTHDELDTIMKRFLVIRGGKRDIDYVEFLTCLDGITYVDPVTLEELSPTGVEWYKQLHPVC